MLIFQIAQMGCQIAVGYVQQFFQGIKIQVIIDHQGRHQCKPYFIFKCFIEVSENLFHDP